MTELQQQCRNEGNVPTRRYVTQASDAQPLLLDLSKLEPDHDLS